MSRQCWSVRRDLYYVPCTLTFDVVERLMGLGKVTWERLAWEEREKQHINPKPFTQLYAAHGRSQRSVPAPSLSFTSSSVSSSAFSSHLPELQFVGTSEAGRPDTLRHSRPRPLAT